MLVRKLIAAPLAAAVAVLVLSLLIPIFDETFLQRMLIYALYIVPVMLTFGTAASYFSEKLAVKTKYTETVMIALHVFFGWSFFAAYGLYDWLRWGMGTELAPHLFNLLSIGGIFCAVTFYVTDSVFRLRKNESADVTE
ncbi:hypothetical protein [Alteribacter natronophilus]|uniref:hypothetical protein n=1 Tax=Alteribacter natronophilus TaxID=2583810 RepID=UPI00110E2662|nr:hypothetical protein [Alteribacter natronophilus]TMW70884.1 hypothetical protein FGB90_12935 [Alteribacter natronophilus]